MIKTKNIIDIIKGDINISKLKLMIKNRTSGEVYATMSNYIADEILFVFKNEDTSTALTCKDFIENIKYESEDECWELTYFSKETREVEGPDLATALVDLIISFPIKVYLGSVGDDPTAYLRDRNVVKNIVALEITSDALYLITR